MSNNFGGNQWDEDYNSARRREKTMPKATVTTTIEYSAEDFKNFLREKLKLKNETHIQFVISDVSDCRFGGVPNYELTKVRIIEEIEANSF